MRTLFKIDLRDIAGLFTIGAVALISYLSIEDPGARWIALGIALAFAGLLFFCPRSLGLAGFHVYLAAQTALVIALMLLRPSTFSAPILFFILSAEAMVTLPLRQAMLWIVAFVAITGMYLVLAVGWFIGLVTLLPNAGGFLFFGTFGRALRQAQEERTRSHQLLEELRAAQSQLQELAVAEERNRLAREMHDSLGHRLTVAVVQLEGAQRLLADNPDRAARMIGAMREQMKEALAELRRTVAAMRTPLEDITAIPLDEALTRLVQTFRDSTGLPVQLELPAHLPALPETHRLALYRAAQESLTNVQRHAAARQAWLTMNVTNNHITLTAADDGKGFAQELKLNGDGFGLRSLRERAAQLGGELVLEGRPGGGAQLHFSLPFPSTVGRVDNLLHHESAHA